MKSSGFCRRLAAGVLLGVAEAAVVLVLCLASFTDASAQFFDDRFPFFGSGHRQRQFQMPFFQPFQQQETPRAQVDYSKAPPPKAPETTSQPLTSVVVMGDAMADWLAYGLETAFTDSPDIGVVRNHRTQSGLIHNEVRVDPRGLYPDWPTLARELLNTEKANFVVMMIGLNDRQSIKERQPPRPVNPPVNTQGAQQPASPPTNSQTGQPSPQQDAQAKAPEDYEQTPAPDASPAPTEQPQQGKGNGTYEFHTDKWAELYSKRIDETIAALKSKGATVVWVGLPPVRGTKTSSDIAYLNDLFHSRADKAGIVYVDVWDGFVDEGGHYTQFGPDVEGQTRRLRTSDGVYFTQAGARKLAHYVQREIDRVMTSRTTPIAVPVQIEPTTQEAAPAHPGGAMARPLAGPVMPLTAALNTAGPDELAGGSAVHQSLPDAVANRVLVKGDPVPAPQGRADDYAWPRRDVAATGTDPIASTTTFPMTPMIPERPAQAPTAAASLGSEGSPNASAQPQHNSSGPKLSGNAWRQREAQRKQSFPFYFLFPGR